MEKVIIIKKLRNMDVLNEQGNKLINEFNNSGKHLQLVAYTCYECEGIEAILDQGAYDYVATPEIEELLYELADNAMPMMFDLEDVLEVR